MHIEIAAHHQHVSDDLRGYVDHIAERFTHIFDGLIGLHLTLGSQKDRREAELVLNVSHGEPIIAKATNGNLYAAIHTAADRVEKQLRRHKEKVRDHHARDVLAAEQREEKQAVSEDEEDNDEYIEEAAE
ncbi:ribosome-associated translation inhibitor RaiA [bacterium]|nr:ribosome-associated translation inhibitor RaiA [bacterium]